MPFYYRLNRSDSGKRVAEGLLRLRAQLDREVPERSREATLLLASWNIREFDSPAYGERIEDAFYYIAEIISRFDLVAIQEVRKDPKALDRLVGILGRWWKYVVTDVTEGKRGFNERMAFLYDSRKVRFGGLAGEIVIPPRTVTLEGGKKILEPADQLYRTPYIAAFQAGWFKFVLCTVHILYGEGVANNPERQAEIRAVARFLEKRVKDPTSWSPNLILLGDFNIFSRDDLTFDELVRAGFRVPEELQSLKGTNVSRDKFYDQIAFSARAQAAVRARSAGVLDFYESVFRGEDEQMYVPDMGAAHETTSKGEPRKDPSRYYKSFWRTHQMSDHLPMWIELEVDFGEEYLRSIAMP